jgi:hypothetical protein
MIYLLIPTTPVRERIIPIFEVGSSLAAPNVHDVAVIQKSEVPNIVIDEEKDQPQNLENNVPNQENLRRSQRVRKLVIPDNYEIFAAEEIHMEDDPTSYEEAMRSPHSSKWCEAMEDEMGSTSANQVWKLE